MKKLFLVTAIAVFGFSNVNAQEETTTGGFDQGDVYVSGTVRFNSQSQDEVKNNNLTFSPTVGYFISDNIALEVNLLIGSAKQEVGEAENKQSIFGAGLGANYFFTPTNQFSFTTGLQLGYSNRKSETNGEEDFKLDTIIVSVAPGINYFISNDFAVRASIGALSYTTAKEDGDNAEAVNIFGLNLDLSDINFGITYKF